jgi:ribokinase
MAFQREKGEKAMAGILVVGGLIYDLVARAPRRPQKGETLLGTSFGMFPGGKGGNQAVQAARLGVDTAMIAKVGNDFFAREIIKTLQDAGVNTNYVVTDEGSSTAVGNIVVDGDGDNSIVVVPGANMKLTTHEVERAEPLFREAKILLLQMEVPFETSLYAAKKAMQTGVKVILDPAPAPEFDISAIFAYSDIVKPNETEASILTGVNVLDEGSAIEAAKVLRSKGAKTVIITRGEYGAVLLDNNYCESFPSYKIKAIDSTAAGDAFAGGLAVGVYKGMDIRNALRYGQAAAALSATRHGAMPSLATHQELETFMKSNNPTKVFN